MGNCIFYKEKKSYPKRERACDEYEASPLMPNINRLQQICEKEICALCEQKSNSLEIISENESISNIVFCLECRIKLGYNIND